MNVTNSEFFGKRKYHCREEEDDENEEVDEIDDFQYNQNINNCNSNR